MNRTSDLLDSLAKALQIPELSCVDVKDGVMLPEMFKANVVIERATHILSGRKKKMKMNKDSQNNMGCPGVYVSFEVEGEVKVTKVVNAAKPKWDYRVDVDLPVELLTNVSEL